MHVVFLVYPNVTQLDFTGPAQVLSRLPDARIDLIWKTRDPVPTDAGFSVLLPRRSPRSTGPTSSAFPEGSAALALWRMPKSSLGSPASAPTRNG